MGSRLNMPASNERFEPGTITHSILRLNSGPGGWHGLSTRPTYLRLTPASQILDASLPVYSLSPERRGRGIDRASHKISSMGQSLRMAFLGLEMLRQSYCQCNNR